MIGALPFIQPQQGCGRQRNTICQVLHGLEVGGAEVLAARLARRLQSSYRFIFACLDQLGTLGRALQTEGFPVHVLARRPGIDASCIRRLAALFRAERVDLVHAHQYSPFFYSLVARILYRRPAIIFTEHGRLYPDYPRPKRILINRLMLQRRDRVIAVGHAIRQALIDNEGIPAKRVRVIYNGIDLAAFRDAVHPRHELRREMGVDPDDVVILQVARFDPIKDHATALRALVRVVRRHPSVRLVLAGEGPERPAIEELVRRNELETFVRFLGLRTDVARLLAAADLCLLTSVSEGIPLTLIEAMAAGLPVVATRVGGVEEVVQNGSTGFLALPSDDNLLAELICRLIQDPALRRQLGERGHERAEALFSEIEMHLDYTRLYREILS